MPLTAILETRSQPDLSELWSDVDTNYSQRPESFKAEELFCLACEAVEPDSNVDRPRAERTFHRVVLARSRPMEYGDLFTIAVMVADGLKNRTRFQQTFPATDNDQWSREGN